MVHTVWIAIAYILCSAFVNVRGQGLELHYKCFGGYFTDTLCTGERTISIQAAQYGVSACSEFNCCPEEGDCTITVADRNPSYYKDVQDQCNGKQACGNGLRADRVPPAPECTGLSTHYVMIYYVCLLDGELPNITLPTTTRRPTTEQVSLTTDPGDVGSTTPWREGGPLGHLHFNPLWTIGGLILSALLLGIPFAVAKKMENDKKRNEEKAAKSTAPVTTQNVHSNGFPEEFEEMWDDEEWDEYDDDDFETYTNGDVPGRRVTRKSRKTRRGNQSVRSVQNNGDPIYDVIDPEYVAKIHAGVHIEPSYPNPHLEQFREKHKYDMDTPKSGTWGGHRPNNLDVVDKKRKTLGISGTGLSSTVSDERVMVNNDVYEGGSPMFPRHPVYPTHPNQGRPEVPLAYQSTGARPPLPPLAPTQDNVSDDIYLDPIQTPVGPQPQQFTNPSLSYQPLNPRTQLSSRVPEVAQEHYGEIYRNEGYGGDYRGDTREDYRGEYRGDERGRSDTRTSDIYCEVDLGNAKVSYA